MRVLFLSETSNRSASGSAQIHRLNKLREGLEQLGIDTSFLSLRDAPFSRPTILFPLNLPWVRSQFRNVDFVHAIGDAAYAAALWKPFTGVPVVHDVDADTLAEARMHWEAHKSLRNAFYVMQEAAMNSVGYRASDWFITVSKPLEARLVNQKGVPSNLVHIVRNGVDTDLFCPAHDVLDGPFTVCYAGGFHVWQGIENLISAARLLKTEPIRFKIIGFRQDDEELKARISAELGERVELVGRLAQSELVKHLSAAHVLIIPRLPHPAVEIAFPTKFSEYLALGKPVIVTRVDETADMVQAHECGLVSEPSPSALAQTIQHAAALDRRELSRMGQNGRRLAETVFDWQVVCRGYADLLDQWKA